MQIAILFQKPHVSVYDKTKKEIISMSAGKSLDMTDKSWTQHRKLKLNRIMGRENRF